MPVPILGVPYHKKYANEAFKQTVTTLERDFNFKIKLLDWENFNEKHPTEMINQSIVTIDGLLIPGGHYGMDLKLHGSDERDNLRDRHFKICMINEAVRRGMPVLGICAGIAVINLALGGSLELIPKDIKPAVDHDIDPLKGALAHPITVEPDTHLHDILRGKDKHQDKITMQVNSWHHATVKKLGNNIRVSAKAPDQVIEAIELSHPGHPNLFGLQFHPEYVDPKKNPKEYALQSRILRAFEKACVQYQFKHKLNITITAIKVKMGFFTEKLLKPSQLSETKNLPKARL